MKCPECGGEMEEGYLTIPLHDGLQSMKWSQEPRHSISEDDIIFDPKQMKDPSGEHESLERSAWGVPAFRAHRCRSCNCVLFYHLSPGDTKK